MFCLHVSKSDAGQIVRSRLSSVDFISPNVTLDSVRILILDFLMVSMYLLVKVLVSGQQERISWAAAPFFLSLIYKTCLVLGCKGATRLSTL